MKKISIIIPVYNVAWSIEKCIKSILRQTYSNFELLLINDGSTDESLSICRKYEAIDSRIIVIDKKNTGVSDTRNVGIVNATGEYVTFIDSDDWVTESYIADFDPDSIETLYSVAVQGITYDIPSRGNKIMFKYPTLKVHIESGLSEIQKYNLLANGCPVAKLFSLRLIRENNLLFNKDISLNEDHIFVLDYYRYVNTLYLKGAVNYHYYFNYKVPSLTKIKHDYREFFSTSNLINQSFLQLCKSWSIEPGYLSENVLKIFGPQQLINAVYAILLKEKNKYELYIQVLDRWRSLNLSSYMNNQSGGFMRYFIIAESMKNTRWAFTFLYLCACSCELFNYCKYLVKRYILRY